MAIATCNGTTVTLTMSLEEAQTIIRMTRLVAGDPAFSARRHADAVRVSLCKASINSNGLAFYHMYEEMGISGCLRADKDI